ncbi:MAG: tetratricopeptide repeat protein, partial [Planctomycetota bacterium]
VSAYRGEPIGQVHHPELGGVLLGGIGLQVYQLGCQVADDIRVRSHLRLNRGHEVVFFLRGVPPAPCYILSIGAYQGRWLTVARSSGEQDLFQPNLLSMRPMPSFDITDMALEVTLVGSRLTVAIDNEVLLVVNDPCPLLGSRHRQLAIATDNAQVVVHSLVLEERRSPLMLASYEVANELLRQQMYPQAIEGYRRFLEEHRGSEQSAEAHFMLCQAYLQASRSDQAEAALREFLAEEIDHAHGQDAIFELARLAILPSGIERAVRVVLSYQESGDLVRSRFCLWVMHLLNLRIGEGGLDDSVVTDLRLLRHLIRGFEDEQLLLETLVLGMHQTLVDHAYRVLDSDDSQALRELTHSMIHCRELGYNFALPGLHSERRYDELADRLRAIDHTAGRAELVAAELHGYETVRDRLSLYARGCEDELLLILAGEDIAPEDRILRACINLRRGAAELVQSDLHYCFQMMDRIEMEPIASAHQAQEQQALAATMAEAMGRPGEAAHAYRHLLTAEPGYRALAERGLQRVGVAI